jgi:hypothetical protein
MLRKNVKEIAFDDLNALKEDEVPEDKRLDYKSQLPAFLLIPGQDEAAEDAKRRSKIEFLKDVSAFANTSGGHLLYGIKSENGVPTDIRGVDVGNKGDAYIRRLDQLLDSQLEPRIQSGSRDSGFIALESPKKEKVLAIYVSKSWRAPHRVKLDGQFYKRSASLNPTMDVDDLRIAFTFSESIIRNTKRFKEERIKELILNKTPVKFLSADEDGQLQTARQHWGRTKFILHLIPLDWFASTNYVDLKKAYDNYEKIKPMNGGGNFSSGPVRYNIDGILVFDQDRLGNTQSYTQLYRNGIIEAVEGGGNITGGAGGSTRLIGIQEFERQVTDSLRNYLEMLQILEVDAPIFLFLTLLGVRGVRSLDDYRKSGYAIDRDELDFPEVCIKSYTQRPKMILKDVFSALWNACGEARPEK